MRTHSLDWAPVGLALLLISCGGSSGQTGDAGSGGGGHAGNSAAGGAGGGQSAGAGGQSGGAGGAGASCGIPAPCGGDIVGTWKVTKTCATATQDLSNTCPGAFADLTYTFSGTVTYNANGTISQTITGTIAGHEYFPTGCMPFGSTCDQLAQAQMDAGTGSCSTDATGACICDAVAPGTITNVPVSYTTSGTTITTTRQDGTTATSSYCVQGNVLYDTAAPGDGGLPEMGYLVFTKQ